MREIVETKDYYYKYFEDLKGYGVMVKNIYKTEYEPLLPEIDGIPLKSVKHTFRDCLFLAVAPVIPESVTDIFATFDGCMSLTKTPKFQKV